MNQLVFSLREQIVDQLRSDVLCGRLVEGARLNELMLVERFGVSRTPIREALQQLRQEGLLEGRANAGVRVARRPPDSLRDLVVPIRRSVETFALRAFFGTITQSDYELWSDILVNLKEACQARDWPAVASHDIAFHRSIVCRSHQRDLEAIWSSLLARVRSHFWETQYRVYADPIEIYREHVRIIDAFKTGDVEAAVEALGENIA